MNRCVCFLTFSLLDFYAKFLSSLSSFAYPSRNAAAIGLCFYTCCGKG
jgi:hypothetical protein